MIPLVVIVGPTASGKSALAIKLAKKFGGEIVCADSRTVYTGMDIGTAKPTAQERAEVPHWGLDLVEPNELFTAADFKRYANEKIEQIRRRGRIPFLVGGTGLYVDAVIFDYQFGPPADKARRAVLEAMSVEKLQMYCKINNITLPTNPANKRHLVRAIEQKSINAKRRNTPIDSSIVVGITTNKEQLQVRIAERCEQLFDDGVVSEATLLGKKYGWNSQAMTGNIYPLIHRYLDNELTLEDTKQKFISLDWQLARRQLTWLRRNPFIHWASLPETEDYISRQLSRYVVS